MNAIKKKIIAICGIDTGVGKTVVTGLLAAFLAGHGHRVITQKPVQTGCDGRPEDIVFHRRLMNAPWNEYDEQGLTCSYCFSFAGSPHLAARLADKRIEQAVIDRATEALAADHDHVLLEGAGGLLVPFSKNLLQLDYFQQCGYPLILVTTPRLGSINHTLLAIEAIRTRNMFLAGLVYNVYGKHPLELILDSRRVMEQGLRSYGFACPLLLLPDFHESRSSNWQPILDNCYSSIQAADFSL